VTNVQVREVPEAVLDALKQRAATQGISLQRLLRAVLVAEASVSTNSAVLADAANDAEGFAAKAGDAAAELARQRADRDT
jgi:plasmid stability protein